LQPPSSISHDLTSSNVAAPPPSEEADVALEGRTPIADSTGSPSKWRAPGRPDHRVHFVREILKTAATAFIFGLAVLAALVIWDFYVTAPWTRDGSVRA
jgi:hypothetical protein